MNPFVIAIYTKMLAVVIILVGYRSFWYIQAKYTIRTLPEL